MKTNIRKCISEKLDNMLIVLIKGNTNERVKYKRTDALERVHFRVLYKSFTTNLNILVASYFIND